MSDGCWVQFWDSDDFKDATLRIDGPIFVNNLDSYIQSDGDKEGNEPDSLKTGSRTWLEVFQDDNFGGRTARFDPNSEIKDLDDYGMGGNISSIKMHDERPVGWVPTTTGSPTAIEATGSWIQSGDVNDYLRTMTVAALNLIPEVGGCLGTLVDAIWPEGESSTEQLWASCQNYINEVVAGVYWQLEYAGLNSRLKALADQGRRYANVPVEDQSAKVREFTLFYGLANEDNSYFFDADQPQRKLGFLVPFATLRLAALRENLQHFPYYNNGQEPSPSLRAALVDEIQRAISDYQTALETAKTNVITERKSLISVQEPSRDVWQVIDNYNGWTGEKTNSATANTDLNQYKDQVANEDGLLLSLYDATGQLWSYFDPDNTSLISPPVIEYASGPFGDYQSETSFDKKAADGQRVTAMEMWSSSLIDALQLWVDGAGTGKVGGSGGAQQRLDLSAGETICAVKGYQTGLINELEFITSTGRSMKGGIDGGVPQRQFDVEPLAESIETALTGISGQAKSGTSSTANIKAITFHWRASLNIVPPSTQAKRTVAARGGEAAALPGEGP